MKQIRKIQQKGFTIIEIMIALLLSAILLGGVVQVYVGSKQSYNLAENVSRMQENSRFAMTILTKEIRMAGFSPCPRTTDVAVTLDPAYNGAATNFSNGSIVGFEGGVSTFTADFPAAGTTAGDRVADSDAFILIRGGDQSYTVTGHNASSAVITVLDATGLEDGDILMVCDPNNTAIFQTSNITVASGTVVHNPGGAGIVPGNCTKGLGYPVACTALGTAYNYDNDAQIVKLISTVYYLGVSQSGNSNSLYRKSLATNTGGTLAAGAAVELIDGIESMQLLYGYDANNDLLADRYITADQVGAANWNNVISVRLALLTHTPDEVRPEDDTKTYYLAGTLFDDTDHGNDGRLRQVYTSTIKIRNRGEL